MGRLVSICVSQRKGVTKTPVPEARVEIDHGIVGDAHAGPWHRQVSLLAQADIDSMRAKGLELLPGAFAENLVVDGLRLEHLGVGSRLSVGEVELEITQLGKECHQRCAIYWQTGDCIMPRLGLFARVRRGGTLRAGDPVTIDSVVTRADASTVLS